LQKGKTRSTEFYENNLNIDLVYVINMDIWFCKRGYRMSKKFLFLLILFGFCGCATVSVPIHNYRRVAVVDFQGPADKPSAGRKLENLISTGLIHRKYYSVMERNQIEKLLSEQQYSRLKSTDKTAVLTAGKILGVNAVVFGNVTSYKVEKYRGEEFVKEKLKEETTRTKTDEFEVITTKEGLEVIPSKVPKEKEYIDMETSIGQQTEKEEEVKTRETLLAKEIISKKGYVNADVRMVDVNTGEIIQSRTKSKKAVYIATTTRQAISIPADEIILDSLLAGLARDFVSLLSPGRIGKRRVLLKGKDPFTKLGVKYASGGLWDEAVSGWWKAIEANSNNAYAYNNLGVAFEKGGKHDDAIASYRKALEILPDNKTIMGNLLKARNTE
jgi:superkiller protein 3